MVEGTTVERNACATNGKNWLMMMRIITIGKTTVSFKDTFRNPDCVASNRRMNLNSELEKKCNNSGMLQFQTLY